jgi:uncharacterized membrane protein YeaQ/YmgE (transglycosylase-associated protein family)
LGADPQPVECDEARCLFGSPLRRVETLELRHLAAHKAQHHPLVLHETQRCKIAGARRVIFEQEVIDPGLAEEALRDRLAGPSWLARQFSGSTRGIITSALVGVAGAFVGYHVAVLLTVGGGLLTSVIAAAAGAAVVLFVWRMAK